MTRTVKFLRDRNCFPSMAALGMAALLIATTMRPALAATGPVDVDNEYPHAGAMVVVFPPEFGIPPFVACSGTLIHPSVFLTAGHCTVQVSHLGFPTEWLRISFGVDALDPDTWLEIETAVTHPDFPEPFFDSKPFPEITLGEEAPDIGVVILKYPVHDITPALLPPAGLLDDFQTQGILQQLNPVLAGYGATNDLPPGGLTPSDGLRRLADPDYRGLRDNHVLMSNSETGEADGAAPGDSGGGVLLTADDGSCVVTAIVTGGPIPAGSATPGLAVYNRIDTPRSLDFIEGVIEIIEGP